jgi:hypothetical protein
VAGDPRALRGNVPRVLEQVQERDGDDVRSETRNIAIMMIVLHVLKSVVVVLLVESTGGSNTPVDPRGTEVPQKCRTPNKFSRFRVDSLLLAEGSASDPWYAIWG